MQKKVLFNPGPSLKLCTVYCGDNQCTCSKNPKYKQKTSNTFVQSNTASMEYYRKFTKYIEEFLSTLCQLATEKGIGFSHPDEIIFADDWMASGVIVKWEPQCSNGREAWSPELVFIYNGVEDFTFVCLRAVIYERVFGEYNQKFVVTNENPDKISITPETAFEIFIKLNEYNDNLMKSLNKEDEL